MTARRRRESWAALLAAGLCCAGAPRALAAPPTGGARRALAATPTAGATPAAGGPAAGAPGGPRPGNGGTPAAVVSGVAVIRPAAGDAVLQEASVRIRSELDAAGTRNRLVDCPGFGTAEWRACMDSSAAAWISLGREDGIATIQTIATLPDGLELRRHVRVPPEAGGNDPSVLAVRAVELLRDIYLDIPRITRQSEPAAPAAAKAAPAQSAPAAPSSQVSGRAFAAVGALHGRRGLGTVFGPVFGFGISWASRLTLLGSVSGGPFQQTLRTPASGTDTPAGIDVSQTLAALDLRYEVGPTRIRPYAIAGVGLYAKHVEVGTQGTPPKMVPGSPSALAPLIAVGVGVIGRIFPWLAVTLDFQEVAVLPTQDVTVQDANGGNTTVIGRAGPSDLVELGIVLGQP